MKNYVISVLSDNTVYHIFVSAQNREAALFVAGNKIDAVPDFIECSIDDGMVIDSHRFHFGFACGWDGISTVLID